MIDEARELGVTTLAQKPHNGPGRWPRPSRRPKHSAYCLAALVATLLGVRVSSAAVIQGYRVTLRDGQPNPSASQLAAVAATTVFVDGQPQTPPSGPFVYPDVGTGWHQISTAVPGPGWRVGYTYCQNNVGCSGIDAIDLRPITQGTSFTVRLDNATDTIDMRWFYIPPPLTAPAVPASTYMHIVDSRWGNSNYAYSPSVILDNGIYHAFFCSRGGPGLAPGRGDWDYIRHTQSSDNGATWSAPTIALIDLGAASPADPGYTPDQGGKNAAACDPAVVYWQGYYYLFFGSAEDVGSAPNSLGVYLTVIEVARATTITGPYNLYLMNGAWGTPTPSNPSQAIIRSMSPQSTPSYGAGQPSVVVRNNALHMWYTDTTGAASSHVYMLDSTNPVVWQPGESHQVVVSGPVSSGILDNDVKYDPTFDQFVIYRVEWPNGGSLPSATVSYSSDGLHWPAFRTVVPAGQLPLTYGATGFSSDARGWVTPSNRTIFAFDGPYDQNTVPASPVTGVNWALWDLYGVAVPTVTSTLAAPAAFTGAWPGFDFGLPGDIPFTMRMNGQLVAVVYRPSTAVWYFDTVGFGDSAGTAIQFGLPGDQPQIVSIGGVDRVAVYRPSINQVLVDTDNQTYHTTNLLTLPPWTPLVPATVSQVISNGADLFNGSWLNFNFGLPGDVPLLLQLEPAGAKLPVAYRPPEGNWYINLGGYADYDPARRKVVQWGGLPGDIPRVVNWNGGDHIAVFRPGTGTIVSTDNESYRGSNVVILP